MSENRLACLRPAQLGERLAACPVIYVPVGPIKWHGPHLPVGMDPLNAEDVAIRTCDHTGGIVWPTQFWGTERERRPRQLEYHGLPKATHSVSPYTLGP